MSRDQPLFSFPPMSKSEWKEQATKDLEGQLNDERLIWETPDGLLLDPYYNGEVSASLAYLQRYQNQLQIENDREPNPRHWVNLAPIITSEADAGNQAALQALNQGATGIEFQITQDFNRSNISTLLDGISIPHIIIGFSLPVGMLDCASKIINYVKSQDHSVAALNGYIHCDSIPDQLEALSILKPLPSFKGLVFESTARTPIVLSIANLLASAIQIIDDLINKGSKAESLFNQILFRVHLGRDYFREMARLRIIRMLWHQIALHYGLKNYTPNDIQIQAITTIKTRANDKHDNMLSNTGQAMSAILGGCNLLSVTPHDQALGKHNPFSLRMALNISNLLKEEGYFDKVADPVAGAYFVESLVDQMAERAWEVFQSELSN